MDKEQLYQERYNRILKATNHLEPDRIPIISMTQSYSIGYANTTLSKCLANEDEEYKAYDKTFTDFIWDGTLRYGLTRNMDFYDMLGCNIYFESVDGTVLEHRDLHFMEDCEYQNVINDLMGYIISTFLPRKYPAFRQPYPESKKLLAEACENNYKYSLRHQRRLAHIKNELALPLLQGPSIIPGIDYLLSYLRGFAGISDLRRRPEEVMEAIDVLLEKILLPIISGIEDASGIPFAFAPALFTPFLTRKQFEKFIWPHYKIMLTEYAKRGGKTFLMMEGNWNHVYDLLNDLPKGCVLAHIEKDCIFDTKKTIGKNHTVVGGIDIHDLRYESKQTCIDKVKKVIDSCAPGGGYIFTQNQTVIMESDVNPENLKAVNEFVYEYGKY